MKRLKDRAARKHPATMAEKWHARLNGSPKPMEGKRRADFMALVRADAMAVARVGQIDARVAVDRMRPAVEDGALSQDILAEDRGLLLEVLGQLADPADHLYRQLNLKITPDTQLAYQDAQVLEAPTALASGNYHTVFALKVMGADDVAQDKVFKPLKAKEKNEVGIFAGISRDDSQMAMRNIATVSLAKRLGLDVIVDTELAMIDTGRGPLDPDLGLIMERAPGTKAGSVEPGVLSLPAVFAEVTKLQLLDHLTGQVDRHLNNYFIHVGPNGDAKVTGIDNDLCFGEKLTDPADIRRIESDSLFVPFEGTHLPPVIDTDMERAIQGLAESDLRSILSDKLNEAELDAAGSRLEGLKKYAVSLHLANKVIEPDQWNDPAVQQLFNAQNSYIGRERSKRENF
ncbi:hypothetical protein SAMN05192589_11614 [Paracidovorax valerianellae]|uniref:Uncharacterized protein n=2 Tax=Paracidovorax valerianellae TaxID=187868 RepID=A0A1G7CCC1_9BURK|nr:hypothetical protein SAMN05192589_11614 [Paracidovorax valerianellae]